MFRNTTLALSLLALFSLILLAGCGGSSKDAETDQADLMNDDGPRETVVTLLTTRGEISVRFFPETSPGHVKNFIEHSRSGLYTGTLFHRVIPGFMIQGGDPNSKDDNPRNDGMGGYGWQGPGTNVDAEFNDIPHKRGILSMARGGDVNSAGSQFFIMHMDYPSLDGKYTVFGEVVDGIEVVDLIVNTPRSPSDRPNEDQKILDVVVEEWSVSRVEMNKADMWAEDRKLP